MSVFGQYAPYQLAAGSWDDQRDAIGRQFVDLISRFAPDIADCIEYSEVLGPPDVEERIGLTGGHIFQGETMPDQMWEHRLSARTPGPGFLPLRRGHPSGGIGHRPQRPQRGRGRPPRHSRSPTAEPAGTRPGRPATTRDLTGHALHGEPARRPGVEPTLDVGDHAKPWARSSDAAIDERYPPAQYTTVGAARIELVETSSSRAIGMRRAPSTTPASCSPGLRTSTTCSCGAPRPPRTLATRRPPRPRPAGRAPRSSGWSTSSRSMSGSWPTT